VQNLEKFGYVQNLEKAWVGPNLKLFGKRNAAFYFNTLMLMPVVPAIPTKNERHCSRLR